MDMVASSDYPVLGINRVDYSSDTSTACSKGSLSAIQLDYAGAAGNTISWICYAGGWFTNAGGGHQPVDRIDYANDSATAHPKVIYLLLNNSFAAVQVMQILDTQVVVMVLLSHQQ